MAQDLTMREVWGREIADLSPSRITQMSGTRTRPVSVPLSNKSSVRSG